MIIPKDVPTTDTVFEIPLTKKSRIRLEAKANRAGCAPEQLVRQGIDWIADHADESPGRVFKHIRASSPHCQAMRPDDEGKASSDGEAGSREKRRPSAVVLRPARMAGLIDAARATVEAAEEEATGIPLFRGEPLWQNILGEDTEPEAKRSALFTRLVQGAALWAINSLRVTGIRTGGPSSSPAGQLFEKAPGKERGGKLVRMPITRQAKKKISVKARQFGWDGSKLTRIAIWDLIEHVERRPEKALSYVQEDRDYYQPPNQSNKNHYAYGLMVGLETKKLIEYAPLVLRYVLEGNTSEGSTPEGNATEGSGASEGSASEDNAPEGNFSDADASDGSASQPTSSKPSRQAKPMQKHILRAAGRRIIESDDIGIPLLESGGSREGTDIT
jgi:hypothetical protein